MHLEPRRADPDCPKNMVYGPCGGVTHAGGCEVDERPCPFVERDSAAVWQDPPSPNPTPKRADARAQDTGLPVGPGTRTWVDFRPDPSVEWETQEAAQILAAAGAGVLIGEHLDDPTPHPPRLVAAAVVRAGIPTIATITCRDRTDLQLDEEIAALLEAGVAVIHCVTGDHPAARLGLGSEPSFHRDGTELTWRAARLGATVSVAESPASPPVNLRAGRLRAKQDAGARIAILNHAGGPDAITAFARSCRTEGVTMDLIAPVPVITDKRSASALERFPGLELPPGLVERILGASDPERSGVDEAVRLGRELLDSGDFAGVNLSGRGRDSGLVSRAELMATIAQQLTR